MVQNFSGFLDKISFATSTRIRAISRFSLFVVDRFGKNLAIELEVFVVDELFHVQPFLGGSTALSAPTTPRLGR
jgi:hypothetical protein